MTGVRFTMPKFIPENCTGCSNCWTQCPDSAIPGVVNSVEEVLETALRSASNGQSFDRVRQIGRASRFASGEDLQRWMTIAECLSQFPDTFPHAIRMVLRVLT